MLQLRAFVNERLSAAAVEIFGEFEKAIDLYKAEVTRSKEEVHNLRKQLDFLHDKSAAEAPAAHSTVTADRCDSILLQEKLLPSTPVEMGQESNFSLKAEVAGPSHTNAGVENPDWNYYMFQTDPELAEIKEEQEELGIDSQKQEAVFLSPDDVVSEQDQPEAEVTTELEPLSSDCSAAQSENSDDEDWVESKGAQRRLKTQKSKASQRQTDSTMQRRNAAVSCKVSSVLQTDRSFCHLCGKTFRYVGSLMKHIKTHDKTVDCRVCGKTCKSTDELVDHLRTTHKKAHFCYICGKTFTKVGFLRVHSKVHTQIKEFTCQDCGKVFFRKEHLILHVRTHSGEKPYCCDICGKAFSQSQNLTIHKRSHTGEKPYHCEFCGRLFNTSSHLKTHMRYHSGEKPYHCDICGKHFRQSGQLSRHKMTHTGERPYGCRICGMRYRFAPNLKEHMKVHERETTVASSTCME